MKDTKNLKQIDWQKVGLDTAPKDTRVVVAMSGGVDSSVAASLLAEAGFDVVGVTLQLYDHGMAVGKEKACCAGQDIYDAARVAEKMGFPHYVLDYESRFRQEVIDDFADTYLRGETPIPCIRCNQTVKFRDLYQTAKDLNAEALVTGHYVQRFQEGGAATLNRAVDPQKDQSYFLFATTQEQLNFLRFPLGGLHKEETRAWAEHFGLEVAEKPDSQDICFVPSGHYAKLVQKLRPESVKPGLIRHIDGTLLGEHPGIINYTIGQRKGLGIGGRSDATDPLYVVRLDVATQEVIVGPMQALEMREIFLQEVNWLAGPFAEAAATSPTSCTVKVRSSGAPMPAFVEKFQNGKARVTLETPLYGIASGQACVFYHQDQVLGGGWITSTPCEKAHQA